ncbi:hypothetical protein [Hymenobacter sp. DG25A]|nr:hypothetical protein [Hymenobacter sp. DG25A]
MRRIYQAYTVEVRGLPATFDGGRPGVGYPAALFIGLLLSAPC